MDAEQYMRSVLDGTFTYVDVTGRVITLEVNPDFFPTHNPAHPLRGSKKECSKVWATEEIEILADLCRRKTPYSQIAAMLCRTEEGVRAKIKTMKVRL